jgi:hypothetical protein
VSNINIVVPLDRESIRTLRERAERARRRPQDEAALILERVLAEGKRERYAGACELGEVKNGAA